jgi:hypothetical protein
MQSEHIHKLQRDNASVFKLPSAVHQNIEWLATHLNHVLKFKGSLNIISKTYFPSSHVFKFALSIFPHQISTFSFALLSPTRLLENEDVEAMAPIEVC